MTPTSPGAWVLSCALHSVAIGLIILFTYATRVVEEKAPRVIELVAGPGEDFGAKAAPALGSETGVKLALPKAPPAPAVAPAPTPPAPAPRIAEPAPAIVPVPAPKPEAPKTPAKSKAPPPPKDIAKTIKENVRAADRWARKEAAAERKKEEARITKEQFDRMNAAKKTAAAPPPKGAAGAKVPKIDAKGIAAGVLGGSAESRAGAGGRALQREDGTAIELYDAELLLKLRRAFEEDRPPGLSDTLKVTIVVRSNPDGSLTQAKVETPSGNREFDQAVLAALRRVKMPPRPDKKADVLSFVFTMREE